MARLGLSSSAEVGIKIVDKPVPFLKNLFTSQWREKQKHQLIQCCTMCAIREAFICCSGSLEEDF
jgi:hypothetical protein